jgi:hypothetical protein
MADANPTIALPYNLTAAHCVEAINDIYAYLHAVNSAAAAYGYPRLEDLIQPASFSGLLSELVCRAFVKATDRTLPGLLRNLYPNGRPDLVPRGVYEDDRVLRGDDGIEVKVSRFPSSWQGHNVESGWLLAVLISVDVTTIPIYDRAPTTVERVMVATLEETDWAAAGRNPGSRRTPTASIKVSGRTKLQAGTIYMRPGAASVIREPRVVPVSLEAFPEPEPEG